ncbi:hypothetical protein N7448_010573 [Penicillium atrosanguineum]|nr:hypothetical protein N7448_010573 [Penicillium atrosanguineum]
MKPNLSHSLPVTTPFKKTKILSQFTGNQVTLADEVMNQNLPFSELGVSVFLLSDILALILTPTPSTLTLAQ